MRNKAIVIFLFFLGFVLISSTAYSQRDEVRLNATTNGTTVLVDPEKGVVFYDSGGPTIDETLPGNYKHYEDYSITFCPDAAAGAKLMFTFKELKFSHTEGKDTDTLFFFDGPGVDSPPMTLGNRNFITELDNKIALDSTAYIVNESGCFSARFSSDGSGVSRGWEIEIDVRLPCQKVEVQLTDSFYVSKGGGELVAQPYKYNVNNDPTDMPYIDICIGDSIVLEAKASFPENSVFYEQSESRLYAVWDYGDRVTYKRGNGLLRTGIRYPAMKAYSIILSTTDQNGCTPDSSAAAKVRIAVNPIREILPLSDICTGQEAKLRVGYQGVGDIVLNKVIGTSNAQKKFEQLMFIPDGGVLSGTEGEQCYEASVEFIEFGDARIKSPEDICAICIKMEHSALSDLKIYLKCPDGYSAPIKEMVWNNPDTIDANPGMGYSPHRYMLGIPHGGGIIPSGSDDKLDYSNPDKNPPGIPWQYCWSINENYTGLNSKGVMDTNDLKLSYRLDLVEWEGYDPIPERVLEPSDYENRVGFFKPSSDFQSLVGCRLNGTWTIVVCDDARFDNGWISEWSMDMCSSDLQPWSYSLEVDRVIWDGEGLTSSDNVTADIYHTKGGAYTYGATIIDEIGCTWDTTVNHFVVQGPEIDLGGDTLLCNIASLKLDAGNNPAYTYVWEPGGETSSSIYTDINITTDQYYVVQATNTVADTLGRIRSCSVLDSFLVKIGNRPLTRIQPDKNPLEGCEPFDVYFKNITENAVSHLWVFGDGDSSTVESPKHEYKAGEHELVYYATSPDGCIDSMASTVYVYSRPTPDFRWDPMYPTLKQPAANFINTTEPFSEDNIYLWKVQVDKSNPDAIKYIVDSTNLFFQWNSSTDNLAQGVYSVELRSYTKNTAPSGNIYECADSISYDIRIINDFLQFPNVVTPNGDGMNDTWQITILLEGMAFPRNELAIYTRNGRRIFYKKDIKIESDFWDPKETNTPPGTYIYRFIGKGFDKDVEYTGTIEVLVD